MSCKLTYKFEVDIKKNYNYEHYRVEKGSDVVFVFEKQYRFFTKGNYSFYINYDVNAPNRFRYRQVDNEERNKFEVKLSNLNMLGSFHWFITDNERDIDLMDKLNFHSANSRHYKNHVLSQGYLVVEPKFLKNSDKPLSSLMMQTHISACLGAMSDWVGRLDVADTFKYNAIHFTPFQVFGPSRSCYSLKDHNNVDSMFHEKDYKSTTKELGKKFLLITDIVVNHCSTDHCLLQKNKNIGYNLNNSPHLTPAFIIDRVIHHTFFNLRNNVPHIFTEANYNKHYFEQCFMYEFRTLLEQVKLIEYFLCDPEKIYSDYVDYIANKTLFVYSVSGGKIVKKKFTGKRFGVTFKSHIIHSYISQNLCNDEERESSIKHFINVECEKINSEMRDYYYGCIGTAISNVEKELQHTLPHTFTDALTKLNDTIKLVGRQFHVVRDDKTEFLFENKLDLFEEIDFIDENKFLFKENVLALQGWVPTNYFDEKHAINKNCFKFNDFADENSSVYLCRNLFVWGDCVRLRYPSSLKEIKDYYEDETSNELVSYMLQYVTDLAQNFDGFRLDNCHSSNLWALQLLIDRARAVNNDLLIVAELFTDSIELDNFFVNSLGINYLIRERSTAGHPKEFCRLVHRFSSLPVGSYDETTIYDSFEKLKNYKIKLRKSQLPRALLTDQTHDNNPSIIERFSGYEILPTTAFVCMASCAIGSVRGFDEMYPEQVSVVGETKKYLSASQFDYNKKQVAKNHFCSISSGTGAIRAFLNALHVEMDKSGYTQIYIDHFEPDPIISITRFNPHKLESIVCIIHCCYNEDYFKCYNKDYKHIKVNIPGKICKILLEASTRRKNGTSVSEEGEYFYPDKFYEHSYKIDHEKSKEEMDFAYCSSSYDENLNRTELILDKFLPSSIMVVKVKHPVNAMYALDEIKCVNSGLYNFDEFYTKRINVENLEFLNDWAFKCWPEERDSDWLQKSPGLANNYTIPNHGDLVYAGAMGVAFVLKKHIAEDNDLGHPVADHLRQGLWLLDWQNARMHAICDIKYSEDEHCNNLKNTVSHIFKCMRALPYFLWPAYTASFFVNLQRFVLKSVALKYVRNKDYKNNFVNWLIFSSFSLYGCTKSARLKEVNELRAKKVSRCTIAAGVPHFSTDWMRNWGRDTFISLNGMFMVGNKKEDNSAELLMEAEKVLTQYSKMVKHGLIPNLVGRYNCRDAVWWFLRAVVQYVEITDDFGIFEKCRVMDVLRENLKGCSFREENAGVQLDSNMSDAGFDVNYYFDEETGFISGGNKHNCGTWMDKMGSVDGVNKGTPATPRDGAAVELVALSFVVMKFVFENKERINENEKFADVFEKMHEIINKIEGHFEKCFYAKDAENNSFYKDTFHKEKDEADMKIRPNFILAIAIAKKSLFKNEARVIKALNTAADQLLSSNCFNVSCYADKNIFGLRTLSVNDKDYNAYYHQQDHSNHKTAGGQNYHNGPAWVWPMGYFIVALSEYCASEVVVSEQPEIAKKTVLLISKILSNAYSYLLQNQWYGLPELFQGDGSTCHDSCFNQAWSNASFIHALNALSKHKLLKELV